MLGFGIAPAAVTSPAADSIAASAISRSRPRSRRMRSASSSVRRAGRVGGSAERTSSLARSALSLILSRGRERGPDPSAAAVRGAAAAESHRNAAITRRFTSAPSDRVPRRWPRRAPVARPCDCASASRCGGPAPAAAAEADRGSSARISAPPMTTMASGFCVSAPMPCDSAAGVSPSIATKVVISTGRSRRSAAWRTPSSSPHPSSHSRCA